MINQEESLPEERETDKYDALFKQLPPLKSHDYIRLLEGPDVEKIPPEVLARCYRQLCAANHREGMEITFRALTRNGNLRKLRRFINKMSHLDQNKFDSEDLEQKAWIKIWTTLPTSRGAYAEINWLVFAKQRIVEAFDEEFGKKASKLKVKIGEENVLIKLVGSIDSQNSENSNETYDLFEIISSDEAADAAPGHARLTANEIPLIEKIIRETINKIPDDFLRKLAEDQFGGNPSPISGDRSKTGKIPLTEQFGFDRDYISRRIHDVRVRLAAALKTNSHLEFDDEIIQKIFKKYNKSVKKQTRS
jgi:hypothetical protein